MERGKVCGFRTLPVPGPRARNRAHHAAQRMAACAALAGLVLAFRLRPLSAALIVGGSLVAVAGSRMIVRR